MDIQGIRRKVAAGRYELTHHAKEEAADDNLDIADIESVALTGRIERVLKADPRGFRYVVAGISRDKREAKLVIRALASGNLRIITVYAVK